MPDHLAALAADSDFPVHETDYLFDTLPEYGLFGCIHTPDQLAYLEQWCACPYCGRKPESVEPLPEGWVWDCMAFTVWAWCPECQE
jgi:hypothetical protein